MYLGLGIAIRTWVMLVSRIEHRIHTVFLEPLNPNPIDPCNAGFVLAK